MTDILCTWLNNELQISKRLTPATFAQDFSSGYLIGEVLSKYQLQDDFDQFSPSRAADSKLNNFTRLEPMIHLLGIPFDTTVARDIMLEKHGSATRLLYQMYIALSNKKKANLTQAAMKTLQAPAPAKLGLIETEIFKERLKQAVQRQTDLDLQALVSRFHKHQTMMEQKTFRERLEESDALERERQRERQCLINRSRMLREKQTELVAKINAATVHVSKLPLNRSSKAQEVQKERRRKREAEETVGAIHKFEEKLRAVLPPSDDGFNLDIQYILRRPDDKEETTCMIKGTLNNDYINKIRKRLQEESAAREEREKRRRKVLRDQMIAHQAQEDTRREEMMVNRLLRQSQQERRIVVQLLQARHEKEVIRQNRMLRENQYHERREKDFQDALNREAEVAHQYKLEYVEQIKASQDIHDQIAAQRAEMRYHRHYLMCSDIMESILDFATKVVQYRELTNNLVPAKLMREWKLLFAHGQPLFEQVDLEMQEITAEQVLEEERQQLLDEGDYSEYRAMTGEWLPPESCDIKEPPGENPVVSHIVQRLFTLVHPPSPPAAAPQFPTFPIRVCVLGKPFGGKTTCLNRLALEHNLQILCPETLVQEAIEAHKAREVQTTEQETQADLLEEAAVSSSNIDLNPDNDANNANELGNIAVNGVSDVEKRLSLGNSEMHDGADSDKPVPSEPSKASIDDKTVKHSGPEPTVRAQLGSKAMKSLKKGQPVQDQVLVDILAEAIRKVPEGTGWILDNYPRTYNQAKILEKALSGCDGTAADKNKELKKDQKSKLVPRPLPQHQLATPPSGIDVVILFDIRDELCLKRAAGRYRQIQAEKSFHEEFSPPPEGSATGIGKTEKVQPVCDPYYDEQNIQLRIVGFLDNWTKLKKWFVKFGTLRTVDASLEKETVFLETEKIIEDTIDWIKNKEQREASAAEKQEEKEEAPGGPPVVTTQPEVLAEVLAPGGPDDGVARTSKSSSRSSSAKSTNSPTDKKSKSPKGRKSDADSPTRKKTKGAKGKSPERKSHDLNVEFDVLVPVEPQMPKPGDSDWTFVDSSLDNEVAQVLMALWEEIESMYTHNLKTVFRNIRFDREIIYRYLFQIRKDFVHYLQKPDCKQEYVTQWQKTYNEVADDTRDDEEVKAELHQQVKDLVERLWNICDDRKEQAEVERMAIINDEWLEDRMGLLINHYLTIMQAEVDRFQDTVRLLKDYYRGMDGLIPDVFNGHYERIPLLELNCDKPEKSITKTSIAEEDTKVTDKGERLSRTPRQSPKESKSAFAKKKPNEKDGEKSEDHTNAGIGHRIVIPLIPHSSFIAEVDNKLGKVSAKESKEKIVGKKGKDEFSHENIPPPQDSDSKIIYDVYTMAAGVIAQMTHGEMMIKEAEEETEKLKDGEKEKEKAAAKNAKSTKAPKKTSSPTTKKGSKGKEHETSLVLATDQSHNSEEELHKKLIKIRAREELYFAIQEEANAATTRLDLVCLQAYEVLHDLKAKANEVFSAMNDWLGAKFLQEMKSIEHMALVMHNTVELGQKTKYEIILETDNFLVDEDLKVLKTPSPEVPPLPVEEPMADQFTIDQLKNLYTQLSAISPEGIISKKAFTEMLESLVSVTLGTEALPEMWMNLTPSQIEEMSSIVACESDYVDWHSLLVTLCYPIPVPTQHELLVCLQRFKRMDQKNTGTVTREQWPWIQLWFRPEPDREEVFNRLSSLKKLMFEMFADHSSAISTLDYVNFLMYFSVTANYHEGFLRALSVATERHMPRLGITFPLVTAQSKHSHDSTDNKDEDVKCTEPPMSDEVIPPEAQDAEVSLEALFKVLHHNDIRSGDSHRFSTAADPEDHTSIERLTAVFQELNEDGGTDPIMYRVLIQHPLIQDVVAAKQFKTLDLKSVISRPSIETF